MPHDLQDVHKIKDQGWRQGSVLPAALANELNDQKLLPWTVSPNEFLIVLSHDCDVTNASLTVEPTVELLRLRAVSARDGNLDWGKNPRRYQFVDSRTSPPMVYEASVHDRVLVPRHCLIGHKPDRARVVDPEILKRLCRWIAGRYTRAAFPNAFNDRVQPAVDELRSLFKSKGHLLTGVYLLVIDAELPEGDDYHVVLIATMLDEQHNDLPARVSGQELLNRIEAIMAGCSGVELEASELRSEADVSLDDLRRLKRWDFDDLSLREGSVDDLSPAG